VDQEASRTHRRSFFGAFSDPAEMARAVGGIDPQAQVRPAGAGGGAFYGALARATLAPLTVGVGRFAQGSRQTAAIGNAHTFMFPSEPGVVRRVSGRTLGHRQIFHLRPNAQTATSSPPGMPWAFGIITVSFEALSTLGPALAGEDLSSSLRDDRMFLAPEVGIVRLVGLMNDAARLARDAPWIIEQDEAAAALGGSILEALLTCLSQGVVRPDRAALGRYRQVIARFERALNERPEEMLSLSTICAEVGVARRTLSLACQEFLGRGPMQYARERRLDLVHHRLLAAKSSQVQVTSIAVQYGFWELGRFAQAYRDRFGELPSETLRRGRD